MHHIYPRYRSRIFSVKRLNRYASNDYGAICLCIFYISEDLLYMSLHLIPHTFTILCRLEIFKGKYVVKMKQQIFFSLLHLSMSVNDKPCRHTFACHTKHNSKKVNEKGSTKGICTLIIIP